MSRTVATGGLIHRAAGVATLALTLGVWPVGPAEARIRHGDMVRYDMVFPVDGDHYVRDTFGAARSGGRTHEGQDIMAAKGTPVVAVASGTVRLVNWSRSRDLNPTRCCSLVIDHDDGWQSVYIHLNNDRPGTDDGKGWGIAAGIVPGARVRAGELIGWVGDSGNAENTPAHVHFELLDPSGVNANPFASLLLAGGNPPPGSVPPDGELFSGSGLIRSGDQGESVRSLQRALDGLGYEPGPIDGIFGPRTAAAVMEFQSDFGLLVDGLVGPQTLGGLAGTLGGADPAVIGLGSRGDMVLETQRLLAELGYDPGPRDGIFGPRTLTAVLAFQRSEGLAIDGLAGPQTLRLLGVR